MTRLCIGFLVGAVLFYCANLLYGQTFRAAIPLNESTVEYTGFQTEEDLAKSLARHTFCETTVIGGRDVKVLGFRLSDGVSLGFVLDASGTARDTISRDQIKIASEWVEMQLVLHAGRVEMSMAPKTTFPKPLFLDKDSERRSSPDLLEESISRCWSALDEVSTGSTDGASHHPKEG